MRKFAVANRALPCDDRAGRDSFLYAAKIYTAY